MKRILVMKMLILKRLVKLATEDCNGMAERNWDDDGVLSPVALLISLHPLQLSAVEYALLVPADLFTAVSLSQQHLSFDVTCKRQRFLKQTVQWTAHRREVDSLLGYSAE
jgi:hypothetical protein